MNYVKNRMDLIIDESHGTMENHYLVPAITEDAPRTAAWLIESGTQTVHRSVDKNHQDLIPLCLTLSKSDASTQEELDASQDRMYLSLDTHCWAFLLERGSDPKARTSNGITALGCLRRAPEHWRYSPQKNSATRMLQILIHILDPRETGCHGTELQH
ncbi:hypothetical protein FHL15_003420 [Xylaria flabelliformis]|uniref:Uncharacterized protein n=1 Tax=Xylaria flabelliformis TaxID=2512241 RepID=A0A553I6N8_9PEZI|nr:hypothetical protein FHL15_003420 [Xylaria flabelliformis]